MTCLALTDNWKSVGYCDLERHTSSVWQSSFVKFDTNKPPYRLTPLVRSAHSVSSAAVTSPESANRAYLFALPTSAEKKNCMAM